MHLPIFIRWLINLAVLGVVCLLGNDVVAQEEAQRYVDEKCLENSVCKLLRNELPDFNVEAVVLDVVDGDNLRLKLHLMPGLAYDVNVRARGVDAPEVRTRCEVEREFGEFVRASIRRKFAPGRWVIVNDVEYDAFGGRLLANVERWDSDRFKSLSEELLESFSVRHDHHHAVQYVQDEPYDWCGALTNG